jgi:nucleolar complex protein 2
LDFSIAIRAPKSYLRTRIYQDGVAEQAQELLSEFFVLWAKNIAFPELALPVTVMLKRWLKEVNQRGASKGGNKNQKINTMIQLLVQKLEANARWIEERRAKVDFAPNDRRNVDKFLADISWEKSPLGAYVVGQRKTREEKARLIEESRKEEERRRQKEKDAKAGGEDDVSESEEDEEVEGEDDEESDEDEIMVDGDEEEDDSE